MRSIKRLFLILILLNTILSNSQIILSHNVSNEILSTGMFACTGGGLNWARSFTLSDFGIENNEDLIISSGDFGMYGVSSWDNYIKFNIYRVDKNFPDNFETAILLGSSQIEDVPYFLSSSPIIKTVTFTTPITVPAGTEIILVEVEQVGTTPADHHVFAGLVAHDDAKSWMRSDNPGCGTINYKDIADMGDYSTDESFYITATGTKAVASNKDFMNVKALIYPVPSKAILNIETDENLFSYEITNSLGQLVAKGNFESSQKTISIENLRTGVYIVNLIAEGGKTISRKIIKE